MNNVKKSIIKTRDMALGACCFLLFSGLLYQGFAILHGWDKKAQIERMS